MSHSKKVAIPTSLLDLMLARQKALDWIRESLRALEMAEDILKPYGTSLMPYESRPRNDYAKSVKELDDRMWRRAIDLTGFSQIMDETEMRKFEASLSPTPPEFTEATIRATFIDLQTRADELFRRGVVKIFSTLSDNYKTNAKEPFRIGAKVIMRGMIREGIGSGLIINDSQYSTARDRLNDIDRVVKTLDKLKFKPRSLEAEMNRVLRDSNIYEDEYYRAKAFKNGNLHLEFKRLDLLDKVNEQIAEYYEYGALADARKAQ